MLAIVVSVRRGSQTFFEKLFLSRFHVRCTADSRSGQDSSTSRLRRRHLVAKTGVLCYKTFAVGKSRISPRIQDFSGFFLSWFHRIQRSKLQKTKFYKKSVEECRRRQRTNLQMSGIYVLISALHNHVVSVQAEISLKPNCLNFDGLPGIFTQSYNIAKVCFLSQSPCKIQSFSRNGFSFSNFILLFAQYHGLGA